MLGIKSGMVMQRGDGNVSDIVISSVEKPQKAFYNGSSHGAIEIKELGNSQYRLRGMPTGGPYSVCIDSFVFEQIYVGDVWVLAGQSNMEGVGHLTPEDLSFEPLPDVRALYLSNEWGQARHPLHDLGNAYFKVHALLGGMPKPVMQSAGPGLSFGLTMHMFTGVPQGLICCAHGATNLAYHWNPKRKEEGPGKSLYAAMMKRIEENGKRIKGLFWYQGCSDAEELLFDAYTENMKAFIDAFRNEIGEEFPVVQVQIGNTVSRISNDYCYWWSSIQEQQRLMPEKINRLCTVSAVSKDLDDAIHIGSAGQRELGTEAAQAMYSMIYGTDKNACLPPPEMDFYTVETDETSGWAVLKLRYKYLHGGLAANGRAVGFEVHNVSKTGYPQLVFKTVLAQNTALLYVACFENELSGCSLYYGYGPNPACNVTDSAKRALPVMGPVTL